jgi:translation initiation factor 6
MAYRRAAYFGNPFIGLFFCTNGKHTLFPIDAKDSLVETICSSLGTKGIKINVQAYNLNGMYVAMNDNGIVLPSLASKEEATLLEKETGLAVYVSREKMNAHGNNITLNDMGGLVNPVVKQKERIEMEGCLGIELVPFSVAGFTAMGSLCVANNKGFITHYAASERELAEMGDVLKAKGLPGSVNTGTGFVGIGLLATDKGYFAGEATSSFELGRVEEALGLIE